MAAPTAPWNAGSETAAAAASAAAACAWESWRALSLNWLLLLQRVLSHSRESEGVKMMIRALPVTEVDAEEEDVPNEGEADVGSNEASDPLTYRLRRRRRGTVALPVLSMASKRARNDDAQSLGNEASLRLASRACTLVKTVLKGQNVPSLLF